MSDFVETEHLLEARGISVTFPVRGAVRETGNTRFVRNKRGRATEFKALHDVSFALKSGDRLAVIGENGAGKSTLLRVLSRTQVPDEGSVVSRGHVASLVNINVGIQPQATGHRNITLRGLVAGRTLEQIEERRDWI
ncbi:MAG: ATP-binding cassette domain-containing protein, partial [Henriciella sp.]